MSTSKEEFLSALLDDAAGDFERRRLLDELKKDSELAQTLSRYAYIGEVMRAGQGQRIGTGKSLLSRIQAELDAEPAYDAANVVPLPSKAEGKQVVSRAVHVRWMGMAMAATVAAVAFGTALFLQQPQQSGQMMQANAPQPAAVTTVTAAGVDESLQTLGQLNPQTRDILKQYVAQHVKYASTTVIAPSIRATSYASEN